MSTHGIDLVKVLMQAALVWEDERHPWFEFGDTSEVALVMQRTIHHVLGAPAAYDLGTFWLWSKESRAWVSVSEDAMCGPFLVMSGKPVFASWVEGREGEEAKTKPLRVSNAGIYVVALRQWCASRDLGPGFFDTAARGISFRDSFLAVLPKDGGGLRVGVQTISPDLRCRASYPWDIKGQDVDCPRWRAHLASLWSPEEVQLFGQFLGAAILGVATHFGRALYLVGSKGSGKSTLLEVVRALMPDGAISYVAPSDWADKHKPGLLMGSRLNLVFEADDQGALMAQAQIRQVISGEPMVVDKKYSQPLIFSPICAHIFATNGQPIVPGAHAAFWDRFLILTLDKTIRGTDREIRDYHRVLLEEREAIIAWALDLVIPALAEGSYTIPGSVAARVDEWRIDADSVASFTDEMCAPCEDWTDTMDLYKDYVGWCERGGQRPVSVRNFGARLKDTVECRKDSRTRRAQVKLKRKLY